MNLIPILGSYYRPAAFFGMSAQVGSTEILPQKLASYQHPPQSGTITYDIPGQGQQSTEVTSLIGGEQIFTEITRRMDEAKPGDSIFLTMYNFQSPDLYPERKSPSGTPGAWLQAQLVKKLVALRQKGVRIGVILDNSQDERLNERYNQRTIDFLKANGISVRTYPLKRTLINHVKLFWMDCGKTQTAVVGGMNWGNHSPTNHDAAVMLEGPDARNIFTDIFRPDWLSSGGTAAELPDIQRFSQAKIKVLQTTAPPEVGDTGQAEIFDELLRQISTMQDSMMAELYVLTQKDVIDRLIDRHKELLKQGKKGVKILVDPGIFYQFPKSCQPGIRRLIKEGIPVRFYDSDFSIEEKLHAKWAVFDRKRLLIGSTNWSNAGLKGYHRSDLGSIRQGNHEMALLIDSPEVAENFARQFEWDWEESGITLWQSERKVKSIDAKYLAYRS